MWEKLSLVRVYTKPRGAKAPDYTAPVVLKKDKCTVEDFCAFARLFVRLGNELTPGFAGNAIHKDISKQLKHAMVGLPADVEDRLLCCRIDATIDS